MKKLLLLPFILICVHLTAQVEPCFDPELIDPDMGCFEVWEPVCGCDSVTYTNSCYAQYYYGITSWTEGECENSLGMCPELEPGLDFGLCLAVVGVALIDGQCVTISGCSTVASDGVDYAEYFFYNQAECEACVSQGDCINPDLIDGSVFCTLEYDPVCGCDGITYSNDCFALYGAGVTSWMPGECGSPVDCPQLPQGLDFGDCEAIVGIALINGQCTTISGCSTVASNGVDYSAYFYESDEACQDCADPVDCINPDQIDFGVFCTQEYEPVCGCDGVTYPNDCHAYYYGGVTDWTLGECAGVAPCTDVIDVDFGPCDLFLGYAVLDGSCSSISGCSTTGDDNIDYAGAFFETIEECQNCFDCVNPAQIDSTVVCTQQYDPVCGCDSTTYSNECYAFYVGGVTSWTPGVCLTTGLMDIDADVQLNALLNGELLLETSVPIDGIELIDLTGRVVWREQSLAPGVHRLTVDGGLHGMYVYRLSHKSGVVAGKVFLH